MTGQADMSEIREAFERRQARNIPMSYEDFKKRTDEYEQATGRRYGQHSVNEREWIVWLDAWQAAKASAVPDDCVLVKKSKIHTWYQDGDEPENIANSADDIECLGDVLDGDEIMEVNVYESAHISKKTVFGVWKSNSPTDIESNFVLVDTYEEAEEILAANKAMIEAAQELPDV